MKTLALILGLLAPALAVAGQAPKTAVTLFDSTNSAMLSGVALNATASDRTITLNVGKNWAKLRLGLAYTYSAATTVTDQITCQYSSGGTYYRRTTKSCVSGTCTNYLQSGTYTTGGASANYEVEYDVRGCLNVQILLGGASADASDLVTTEAVVIVGD